ncbi:MAG: hypothetical protein WCG99_03795 [Candidatus Berkelbacteria bacterium]
MKKFLYKFLVIMIAFGMLTPSWITKMWQPTKAEAAGINTQDFGVMQISGVNGYSVGFGLLGMTASDLKFAKVELFKDGTLLSASNALIPSANWTGIASATSLSSPFNINGYFDYATDGYWANSGWNGTVSDVPTKARVSITDNSDITYSGEYGAPTGNPALLLPSDYVEPASLAVVHPEDFGTMRSSGVSGYTVGFGTAPYTASHFKKIEIKLYEGVTLLATTTSDQAMIQYPTATSLSSPFDVNGTFDYVADAAWTYSGWNGTLANIPTRAVIKVTDKMDNTYTVENHTLTGSPLPYMVAEDFGVMQISGVNGYTVGFGLNGITAADVSSVKVELFKGTTLLSTSNALIPSANWAGIASATSLSSPFNIDGSFDYASDGFWSNTGWNGSLLDVPTRAVITLIDALGARYTAENTNLTGDPSLLLPVNLNQNPTILSAFQSADKTISINFNGAGIGATDYIIFANGIQVATIKNILGNDTGNLYHLDVNVSAYQSYAVRILALHYGYEVGGSFIINANVKASQTSSGNVTEAVATTVSTVTDITQPETPSVSSTTETPTVTTPTEQGQIKGTTATESQESEKINWTPWIILFILILLAGAATGGYFYWFGRDDEEEIVSKEVIEKNKKPVAKVAPKKVKKVSPKKSKRW